MWSQPGVDVDAGAAWELPEVAFARQPGGRLMGSSAWVSVVPYEPDLSVALGRLRRQIFDDHEYHYLPDDDGWPTTMDQLGDDPDGTHSPLDVSRVIGAQEPDAFGTVRPLLLEERLRYFGTMTPTRAIFEQAYRAGALDGQGIRWSGYSTDLFADGRPTEIAIWGSSGD
jgi:hypothetical protein